MAVVPNIITAENSARMQRGELYYAFTPELTAVRKQTKKAFHAFNQAYSSEDQPTRRKLVELWKKVVHDDTPLPPPGASEDEDEVILQDEPFVDGPIKLDYGYNVKLGKGVYLNNNSTFIDTCPITIGARTLIGPSCSFYSGSHPLDPFLRNGTNGPEHGAPISIGEDCWLGGNVIVLPGVSIGRGVVVGAGSVVTRDVGDFNVVAGNPARVIRKIKVEERDLKVVEAEVKREGLVKARMGV